LGIFHISQFLIYILLAILIGFNVINSTIFLIFVVYIWVKIILMLRFCFLLHEPIKFAKILEILGVELSGGLYYLGAGLYSIIGWVKSLSYLSKSKQTWK